MFRRAPHPAMRGSARISPASFPAEVRMEGRMYEHRVAENMKITRTELYLTVENNKDAADKVDLLKVFQLTRNLYAANQTEENTEEPDGD